MWKHPGIANQRTRSASYYHCRPTKLLLPSAADKGWHSTKRPYSTVAPTVHQFYRGKYPFCYIVYVAGHHSSEAKTTKEKHPATEPKPQTIINHYCFIGVIFQILFTSIHLYNIGTFLNGLCG